jgi:1-phosphofructokinase family hexose kinase
VAGGKGLNVARAATLLGAEVRIVAPLAGHAGRWLADELDREGIAGRFAWVDGETRTCFAIHDATDDTLTELNEAGPTLDARAWAALVETLREEIGAGGVGLVTISGSLPPGAQPDGLAQLLATAHRAGVPVALDAGGPALSAALESQPWLVKLNVAEAAATLGRSVGPDASAARDAAVAIATLTGGAVVVTRGIDGAVAFSQDGTVLEVPPPLSRGAYPVGSGDAFLAGLATAILRGEPFPDALRLASAAAAANARVRGAGRLDPAEAYRDAPAIRIEPLPG